MAGSGAHWANLLVERINSDLRAQAILGARNNIDYLNQELPDVSVVEHRQVIMNILERQVRKIMLAKFRREFAYRIIDPAEVPPVGEYIKPKRRKMVALGFVLGGGVGLFAAFIRGILRRSKETGVDHSIA